jgi:geranylgeranyl transferase type-2 subunit beta
MSFIQYSVSQVGRTRYWPTMLIAHHLRPGLSLLGYPDLDDLDPVYCMPSRLIESLGLKKDWVALGRRT